VSLALAALLALAAGALVGASRSLNGRLAFSSSALAASFWNHVAGFVFLSAWALIFGGLMPQGLPDAPWTAWLGGTLGVIFVASGSWLVARIGAVTTALLVISGQMVSGVALDLALGLSEGIVRKALGVALILGGMVLAQRRRLEAGGERQ
jgi:transporter family-2 protein